MNIGRNSMIVDEHGHICNFKGYYGGIDPIFRASSLGCSTNLKKNTMSKFKVGDIVRIKAENPYGSDIEKAEILEEGGIIPEPTYLVKDLTNFSNPSLYVYERNIKLITKNNNMNIKEKFVLALTPEPQKSFRKAGITDGDDILTEDGKSIFLSWLLNTKYAEEFKKDIVDNMKEDKCCK